MSDTIITLVNASAVVNAVKYELRTASDWAAFVVENKVTAANVKDFAVEIAALVYPNDERKQTANGTRTRFGNAVQLAAHHLRKNIATETAPKPVALRATLSGEGGGTVTIDPESDL